MPQDIAASFGKSDLPEVHEIHLKSQFAPQTDFWSGLREFYFLC